MVIKFNIIITEKLSVLDLWTAGNVLKEYLNFYFIFYSKLTNKFIGHLYFVFILLEMKTSCHEYVKKINIS